MAIRPLFTALDGHYWTCILTQVNGTSNGEGWLRLCSSAGNSVSETGGSSSDDSKLGGHASSGSTSVPTRGAIMVRIGPFPFPLSLISSLVPLGDSEDSGQGAPGGEVRGDCGGNSVFFLDVDVILNPPAVTSLEGAVAKPIAGFSIMPHVEIEFGTRAEWEWFREGCVEMATAKPGRRDGAGSNGAQGGGKGKRKPKKQDARPADGGLCVYVCMLLIAYSRARGLTLTPTCVLCVPWVPSTDAPSCIFICEDTESAASTRIVYDVSPLRASSIANLLIALSST